MINPRHSMTSNRKNTELVVTALQNLHENRGANIKHITDYIVSKEKMPEASAKRMIMTTLHKGVQFGAIEKKPGALYKLSEDFLDYAKQHRRRRRRRSTSRRRRRRRRRRGRSGSRRRRRRRRGRRRDSNSSFKPRRRHIRKGYSDSSLNDEAASVGLDDVKNSIYT